MKVIEHRISRKTDVDLQGFSAGAEHRRPIDAALDQHDMSPIMVVLDFEGVRSATSSYLKAIWLSLVLAGGNALRGVERSGPSEPPTRDVYPVLVGLSDEVRGEVGVLARAERTIAIEARNRRGASIGRGLVHGDVETSVRETISALMKHGPSSAAQLHEAESSRLAPTAWNNRLNEVCRLRLATRVKESRQMLYALIVREVSYG